MIKQVLFKELFKCCVFVIVVLCNCFLELDSVEVVGSSFQLDFLHKKVKKVTIYFIKGPFIKRLFLCSFDVTADFAFLL